MTAKRGGPGALADLVLSGAVFVIPTGLRIRLYLPTNLALLPAFPVLGRGIPSSMFPVGVNDNRRHHEHGPSAPHR